MEPLTLRVNDACRVLGVGRNSIYALMNSGAVDKVKVCGRTLITTASIKRYVDSLVAS